MGDWVLGGKTMSTLKERALGSPVVKLKRQGSPLFLKNG